MTQVTTGAQMQCMDAVAGKEQKLLQVFISSPFEGMSDLRHAAQEGVIRAGHVPIALERFSLRNQQDIPVIVDSMKSCQVYIAILCDRYGERVDDKALTLVRKLVPGINLSSGISFTELEFRIALHLKERKEMEIFTCVFSQESITRRFELWLSKNYGKKKDAQRIKNAFWNFHGKLRESAFGKPWNLNERSKVVAALPAEVALALHEMDARHLRGWIREPSGLDARVLGTLARNPMTQSIISALGQFQSLDKRATTKPELKQRAAEFFWTEFGTRIREGKMNLFFESGSTVAYAADYIGKNLKAEIGLWTNNVLADLVLWIVHGKGAQMFPQGLPDPQDKFGATFGHIIEKLEADGVAREPAYDGRPLDADAAEAIKKLENHKDSPEIWKGPTLLVGAISGIQVSGNVTIEPTPRMEVNDELWNKIKRLRGLHVGSFKNKVFKRFMYATMLPIVILIDETKIDCPIRAGECHFIFDNEFSWQRFLKNHPVAFCVAAHRERIDKLARVFQGLGLRIAQDAGSSTSGAFVASNDAFADAFYGTPAPLSWVTRKAKGKRQRKRVVTQATASVTTAAQ